MSFYTDLKNIYHLTIKSVRGNNHAERMENFYADQIEIYDDFRRQLLLGRQKLYTSIRVPRGGIWVDLGAGTGWCAEQYIDSIAELSKIYLVDIAPSMLKIAKRRADAHGWKHTEIVVSDACCFRPPEPVDVVTFSYSLTMIPDWRAAIENAWRMLKPGGWIGVVDFYVATKNPAPGFARHSWFTRTFWPAWFRRGDVMISQDHVPFLHERFTVRLFLERRARLPYMLLRIPYFIFIGQKGIDSGFQQNLD